MASKTNVPAMGEKDQRGGGEGRSRNFDRPFMEILSPSSPTPSSLSPPPLSLSSIFPSQQISYRKYYSKQLNSYFPRDSHNFSTLRGKVSFDDSSVTGALHE